MRVSSCLAFESAMLLILLLLLPGSFSASITPLDDDDGSGAGLDRYMLPAGYTVEDTEEQIHFRKEGKPYLKEIECIS